MIVPEGDLPVPNDHEDPGTKREAVSEQADRLEGWLRVFFDLSPDAYYLQDLEGNIIDINRAAEEMLGCGRDELVGKNLLRLGLLSEDELPRVEDSLARNAQGQPAGPDEFVLNLKDGSRIMVDLSTFPLETQGHRLVLAVARDISHRQREEDRLRQRCAELERRVSELSAGLARAKEEAKREETERERAHRALLENERRFRALIENSSDVTVILDADGKTCYASPSVERVLGTTPDEAIGGGLFDSIHPDDVPKVAEAFDRLLRSPGARLCIEVRVRVNEGCYRVVEAVATNMLDDAAVGGVVINMRDVTDRREAEEALRESEAKYAAVVEQATDGVVIAQDGVVVFANRAHAGITGYPVEELVGMPFADMIVPECRGAAVTRYRARLSGEDASPVSETKIRCKDGTVKEIEASAVVIQYMGRPAVLSITRDVTERKKAEQLLRESEGRYRGLFEGILEAIITVTAGGTVTSANPAITRITGWSRDELIGAQFASYVHPDELAMIAELFRATVEGEIDCQRFEARILCKSGEYRLLEIAGRPRVRDGEIVEFIAVAHDVTERREAEQALRESEERYRLLAENLSDVIWTMDTGLKNLYISPSIARLLGYTAEEMANAPLEQRLPPASLELVMQVMAEERAKEASGDDPHRTVTLELELYRKDGSTIWTENSISYLRDSQGRLVGYLGVTRDISDRRAAEEALRESERHYRLLTENVSDVILCTDLQMRPTYVSPSMEKFMGFSVEESMNRGAEESLTPASLEAAANALLNWTSLEGEKRERFASIPLELEFYHKDGHTVWGEVTISYLPNPNGQPFELLMVIRDITERKRAEEALRREEKYFRALIENASDAIVIVDRDGTVRYHSPSHQRLLGYTAEERIGQRMWDCIHPDDSNKVADALNQLLRDGGIAPATEVRLRHKDGSWRVCEAVANNLLDEPAVQGIVVNLRDITDRKQAEEDLSRAMAELSRSNAELEQFAYVASHDLQEPLRMISSYVQLLARRYKDSLDEDAHEFIAYAVDGARRMQGLINDLLTYSRVGTRGKPFEPTDCEEVLEQALANLQIAIEESGATVTHDPLPTVMADGGQLVQLLQNLVGNAVKFRGEEPPRVHVGVEEKADAWVFSVRDNGIGIDPASCERIFLIFQRLHGRGEYPGTGIGLAVCKKIVERHGGRIWVESQPGQGATFFFTLPKQVPQQAQ